MKNEDEIVFEDLQGNPDEVIDVDLGVDEEPGIKRRSQEASGDDVPDSDVEDLSADSADTDDDVGDDDGDTGADELAAARAEAKAAREELDRYRNQQADAQREADKQAVARLDSEIASIEEKLEEAIESGDTKKQVRLTSELTDLKSRRLTTELRVSSEPEPQKQTQASNPKVAAWMSKNRWYSQPGKERYTRITNRIDRDIANEGYDPKSDDYWDELNLRLKREAPELFEAEKKPTRKNGGDRVAPVGDGGGDRSRRASADGRVRLERSDFKVMRKFGLDPNDPSHVKEFARNKLEAEREQRARSRA